MEIRLPKEGMGVTGRSMVFGARKHGAVDQDAIWGYLFIAPQMIGSLCFIFLPAAAAVLLTLVKWDFVTEPVFVALDNFRALLGNTLTFKTVLNTLHYLLLSVPMTMVTATLAALMLNANIRGLVFFRAAFFVPAVTSSVAISLVWTWMYLPQYGIINAVIYQLTGWEGPGWLSEPQWAMFAVSLVAVWTATGRNAVIILAGLKNIPTAYIEAAQIDGAGPLRLFFQIKLPLLTPTLFFVSTMLLIGGVQIFTEPYMMTSGGPNNATRTMMLHIYNMAFKYFEMGPAAVLSLILFAISIAITLLQFKGQNRWVNYDV
jgi:multiple sugar transport system permease protein